MLPTQVAIAPYNDPPENDWLDAGDLLHVAAALQSQAVRDLGPVWRVSSVVSPFQRLTDVPPGYAVLVIVQTKDELPSPLGFHIAEGGQPFALVEYREDWSLLASHELMEMLCDPWGLRTAPGQSLRPGQGQVEYLVEVCDPCQHSTYTINGVLVSDFVTPAYYDPVKTHDSGYSFTGRVTGPRVLLQGGYITWRMQQPDQQMWQAFAPDTERPTNGGDYPSTVDPRRLETGIVFPGTFSREWVDAHTTTTRSGGNRADTKSYRLPSGEPLTAAQTAFEQARGAAEQYGQTLFDEIGELLKQLRRLAFDYDESRALLDDLQTEDGRKAFVDSDNVNQRLANCGLSYVPATVARPANVSDLPSVDDYKQASAAFSNQNRFGVNFNALDEPDLAAWLCWLGGF